MGVEKRESLIGAVVQESRSDRAVRAYYTVHLYRKGVAVKSI
jgi:hypothetical protein